MRLNERGQGRNARTSHVPGWACPVIREGVPSGHRQDAVVRQEPWQRGQQPLEGRLIVSDKGGQGMVAFAHPFGNREWEHPFGRNN